MINLERGIQEDVAPRASPPLARSHLALVRLPEPPGFRGHTCRTGWRMCRNFRSKVFMSFFMTLNILQASAWLTVAIMDDMGELEHMSLRARGVVKYPED